MFSLFKSTVSKVVALAVLACLLIAGCRTLAERREEKNLLKYAKINLKDLNKQARGFVTRRVCFEAYYIGRTNLYPTFPTPFSRSDYVNFAVWPRGARLWKADDIKISYPQMYVGRDTGGMINVETEKPLKILDGLKKYQPITIYGQVVQDNSGYAWVVVDTFKPQDGVQYTDELIRRLKLADEDYTSKEFGTAVKDYKKALALSVPAEVEGHVRKSLGLSHLMLEDWAISETELLRAVAMGAGDAECLIGLSEAQLYLKKYVLAERNARTALRKDPRSAVARANLAISLGRQNRFLSAFEECGEALKLAPANADVLRARGLVEDLDGKVDRAIESYKAAVLSRPADPRIHRELGYLYVKKNDFKSARREFKNVVDSVGPTFQLRYTRGCCLLAGVLETLKEPKEAVTFYRLAQKRDENYIPAFMGLGALYAAGGMYDESLAQFRRVARDLDPKGDDGFKAWRSMAAVHHAKAAKTPASTAAAGDCYEQALKLKPNDYNSWLDLALARWQQEKPDRKAALDALGKCFTLKAEEARPHYLAGVILAELKDFTNAARELENAKRLNPKHARTAFQLGIVYRSLGNDTQALSELRTARKLDGKDPNLTLNIKNSLAYCLADMGRAGDLKEAEALAKEVVAAKGGVAAYVDTLGWVQAQTGKLKDAEKTLEDAANKASDANAEVFYHLGYVYNGLRKYKAARNALKKSVLRFNQSDDRSARATHLKGAAQTLLSKVEAEMARIEAERRARVGAVGDPNTQNSSPSAGQKPGKRAKPKKKGKARRSN
jgi:tetratricopeptide (TPR) repeat protein